MGETLLKIAVVGGSGLIGKRHCQHVAENHRTHFCAIVDPGPAASAIASAFSVPLYSSVDALLQSVDKPDAAIVCTPNHTHVPVSIQLARAGVHILCEKPISQDVESARSLIDVAREQDVKLLIGHHRRFNPYIIAMKNAIDSSVLGQVIAVNALWTTIKPADYFEGANAWRSNQAHGGVVLINFIHDIDLMHHLFGPVTRIHAEKTLTRRSKAAEAVEEGAAITLRFASGVVGTFIISDNVASPHSFEQGTGENPNLPQSGLDVYRVLGSQGTLSFPDMICWSYENVESSWNNSMAFEKLQVDNIDVPPLVSQLDHFIDVCNNKSQPTCTGEEALQALVVCEALRSALSSPTGGGTIDFGDLPSAVRPRSRPKI
jgi:predicted dehydrogenase